MANVLLGVCGSVAAIKTPDLYAALRERGFAVKVVDPERALALYVDSAMASARVSIVDPTCRRGISTT